MDDAAWLRQLAKCMEIKHYAPTRGEVLRLREIAERLSSREEVELQKLIDDQRERE